jgi:hypothetical protein
MSDPIERRFGSIGEVVVIFSDCLRALIPYVQRVGIEWEEGKNYDDWDTIAQTLYTTIVANAVAYTVEGEGFKQLAPYSLILPNYAHESILYCSELGPASPFLKLVRSDMPFDTAVFIELDRSGKPTDHEVCISLRRVQLRALLRCGEEQRELVNVILEEKWD